MRRWREGQTQDRRKGSQKQSNRQLTVKEKEAIISIINKPEYQDLTPYQIVALLLDKGIYIASARTFYRVMHEYNQVNHRSNSRAKTKHSKPKEIKAEQSNEVYCWDITWLLSTVKGIYYYLS